uniref:Uncharacterized protein n=1 Tax=Zooxanthella nutricula TaxID=1333877 RepID=A0A7S2PE08_9DINO
MAAKVDVEECKRRLENLKAQGREAKADIQHKESMPRAMHHEAEMCSLQLERLRAQHEQAASDERGAVLGQEEATYALARLQHTAEELHLHARDLERQRRIDTVHQFNPMLWAQDEYRRHVAAQLHAVDAEIAAQHNRLRELKAMALQRKELQWSLMSRMPALHATAARAQRVADAHIQTFSAAHQEAREKEAAHAQEVAGLERELGGAQQRLDQHHARLEECRERHRELKETLVEERSSMSRLGCR